MTKIQEGATSAIIINDKNEILFLKRSEDDDFLPGFWDLPGGGMEYGETLHDAIKREVMEEVGVEIEIIRPVAANTYYMGELQRIDTTFLCKLVTSNIKLSEEHTGYKWLKIDEIESIKLHEYIKNIVLSAKEFVA